MKDEDGSMDDVKIDRSLLLKVMTVIDNLRCSEFIFKGMDYSYLEMADRFKALAIPNVLRHSHPYVEMFVVLDGTCCIEMDDKPFLATPLKFCYIKAGVYHMLTFPESSKPVVILWMAVKGTRVRMHVTRYGVPGMQQFLDGKDIIVDNYLLEVIDREISQKDLNYMEDTLYYLRAYWRMVLKGYSKLEAENEGSSYWDKKILNEVEEYVFNHISEKISLKDISDAVNLSPNYLCSFFKDLKKVNLFDYIHLIKIGQAKEYLASGSKNINEISFLLGYNDPFYFTKVFKRVTGKNPRQYRKDHME